MRQYSAETHHKSTKKGFFKSTTKIVTQRFIVIVGSPEEIRQLTDSGSIKYALSSPSNPQKKQKQRNSGPTNAKSKAKTASTQSSQTQSNARVYRFHLPDCPHKPNMKIRKGRISKSKVRVVVLGSNHHHLVCKGCNKMAKQAVSAAAVKNLST